jgi:quercetin dioxygenase-like cupin family protein
MSAVAPRTKLQYVYDFATLDRVPENPTSAQVAARRLLSGPTLKTGKSSTVGAVLSGDQIIITLGMQARGSGAKAHTHPNEQINYILQGTMVADLEGDRIFAPKGTLMHTPARAVHTGLACPDEDLYFLAMKDTRHGIVGPPVDGKYDGPNYLPGFGTRIGERLLTTAELIAESRGLPPGPGRQYVYETAPSVKSRTSLASAVVTPGAGLALPAGISGMLLTGEKLHVGVLRLASGAAIAAHSHGNEQFTFVVEGEIDADIDGHRLSVGELCALHVPAGLRHSLTARRAALAVTVQDTRHGFAA